MTMYCTLADARAEMKAENTTDDAQLLALVNQVSRRIDLVMGGYSVPSFGPYIDTREYEVCGANVDSGRNVFLLPSGETLLALTSVTLNGTAVTGVAAYPATRSPISMIRRTDSVSWYENDTDDPPTVTISGVWGWHRRYAEAWASVDALAAAIVSTTATTFTVADVDGAGLDGFTPRLSAGNLIRVDDEIMEVTATTVATNTVAVRRGVNGSTAATHLISSAVEVWQTDENIRRVTARQAAFLYARRGAFEAQNITDMGTVTYPSDLLAELRGVLQGFQYI